MPSTTSQLPKEAPARILLIDDDESFRTATARHLSSRNYHVTDLDDGEEALRFAASNRPHLIMLDRHISQQDPIKLLIEIKRVSPESQVIFLVAHDKLEPPTRHERELAFHRLIKPCGVEELADAIEAGLKERQLFLDGALEAKPPFNFRRWLAGGHNFKPGIVALGLCLAAAAAALPTTPGLEAIVSKTGGHALPAKLMAGALLMAVLFWSTAALPHAVTAIAIAALTILAGALSPQLAAAALASEAALTVLCLLCAAAAASRSGLLAALTRALSGARPSPARFILLFLPAVALLSSVFSGALLAAALAPAIAAAYTPAPSAPGQSSSRLAPLLLIAAAFAVNAGGPGTPAAGGRNLISMHILSQFDVNISFWRWAVAGLPLALAAAAAVSLYFLVLLRKDLNLPARSPSPAYSPRAPVLSRSGLFTLAVILGLVAAWLVAGPRLGLAAPALIAVFLLYMGGSLTSEDIAGVPWDVPALYAGASLLFAGLLASGAASWLGLIALSLLPAFSPDGPGLALAAAYLSAFLTNFMSDGAAAATVGSIMIPAASGSGASMSQTGFAIASASSFANVLVVATPANAIIFALAKHPRTGERLLTWRDFLVHGSAILAIELVILTAYFYLAGPLLYAGGAAP